MGESLGKKYPFRRSLGMNLKAKPFVMDVKFLLQFFDKSLADITERSDIIRKYTDINVHLKCLKCLKWTKVPKVGETFHFSSL
jgi:hypothetical protein